MKKKLLISGSVVAFFLILITGLHHYGLVPFSGGKNHQSGIITKWVDDSFHNQTFEPGANVFVALKDDILLDLHWCPPGTFTMGSPAPEKEGYEVGRTPDEIQHSVTLSSGFWIGQSEITQEQYEAVTGKRPAQRFGVGDRYPAHTVSWFDAMEFCSILNETRGALLPNGYRYTLPTEAQWEYACRAQTQTAFNNGAGISSLGASEELDNLGWYWNNGGLLERTAHPVGELQPNNWGLFDTHGNVWEWCYDWYDEDYYKTTDALVDPHGPAVGLFRCMRGGSWLMDAQICRTAWRDYYPPETAVCEVGFRVAVAPIIKE